MRMAIRNKHSNIYIALCKFFSDSNRQGEGKKNWFQSFIAICPQKRLFKAAHRTDDGKHLIETCEMLDVLFFILLFQAHKWKPETTIITMKASMSENCAAAMMMMMMIIKINKWKIFFFSFRRMTGSRQNILEMKTEKCVSCWMGARCCLVGRSLAHSLTRIPRDSRRVGSWSPTVYD